MADADFEQFVGECLPALMRHGHALTGNVHAAEDLVQDTLVRMAGVWRRIDRDGNPLAYARTVMLRTFLTSWRRHRRQPTGPQAPDAPAAGDAYADIDVRDALRRGLAGLPRPQRAVLVLTYLDDLPDDEIAALLRRRPATIRSLRLRGLRTLRERLSTDDLTFLEALRDAN